MKHQPLSPPTPMRLCSICGTRVGETATRCVICGAEFGAGAAPGQQARKTDPQSQVQAAQLEPPLPPAAPQLAPESPPTEPAETTQPTPAGATQPFHMALLARVPLPMLAIFGGLLALLFVLLGLASLLFSTGAASAERDHTATPTSTAPATFTPLPTVTHTPPPTNTPLPPIPHVVEEGESCSSIAIRYDVSVESISQENGLPQSCPIRVHQEILVPQPTHTPDPALISTAVPPGVGTPSTTRHVVVEGESLHSIAELYDVDFEVLAEANNIEPPDYTIKIGMELVIP